MYDSSCTFLNGRIFDEELEKYVNQKIPNRELLLSIKNDGNNLREIFENKNLKNISDIIDEIQKLSSKQETIQENQETKQEEHDVQSEEIEVNKEEYDAKPEEQEVKQEEQIKVIPKQDIAENKMKTEENHEIKIWRDRFYNCYSIIDRISQKEKIKFIQMRARIVNDIKKAIQEKRKTMQRNEEKNDREL